jgi:serine protease Do
MEEPKEIDKTEEDKPLKPAEQKPSNSTKTSHNRMMQIIALILVVLSVGFIGGWLGAGSRSYQQHINGTTDVSKTTVVAEGDLISNLAKEVGPSVVSVSVKTQRNVNSFFGSQAVQEEGAGTGFIISKEGLIATNRHVVPSGTKTVSVTLSDGTELDNVEVVGRTLDSDPLDVAFLKVKDAKGKELKPVKLGDSSKMRVGDKVIAIGNALGQFQNTVTSGIISGYGRQIQAYDGDGTGGETLQNLFQTDAAINQGNSGGPLVNMNGEVIGINTAVAGGGAQNIGFAIPVNDVSGMIKSVLEKGKLERPYLGVHYIELTDEYAKQLGIEQKRGAYIIESSNGDVSIISGSPAEKAGLKEKDVIIKVGQDTVGEGNSLTSLLQKHGVGETVELTIIRDGKEQKIKATLEAAPQN